jgi:predicted O-methyltransferase YrrM
MITKHFILTNPVTRRLYPYLLHFLDGQNIERKLQDLALEETARFVAAQMPAVKAFKNDFALLEHALNAAALDNGGLICEFGVFKGTTINYLASLTSRQIYGFDSFEGLPETWRPNFEKGRFRLKKLPEVRPNVILYKGWFEDSLPKFLAEHKQPASFLHIDCDLYSSTKTIFRFFHDRIRSGTVIVFDEFFNYPGWQEGEYKAFGEFVTESGLGYEWLGYCCYHEQVAVIIK